MPKSPGRLVRGALAPLIYFVALDSQYGASRPRTCCSHARRSAHDQPPAESLLYSHCFGISLRRWRPLILTGSFLDIFILYLVSLTQFYSPLFALPHSLFLWHSTIYLASFTLPPSFTLSHFTLPCHTRCNLNKLVRIYRGS